MNPAKKILVIFSHPALQRSRVNSAMLESIKGIEGISVHSLYDEYPDFHIELKREQQLLLENDIIVFQHPFYWYSSPSILKEWIDLVLEHNFAFGKSGKALKGKQAMSAITTGGSLQVYSDSSFNHYTMKQYLAPFHQTFRLCSMEYLPPFIVHGTHLMQKEEINLYANNYKETLVALRDDLIDHDKMLAAKYMNDLLPLKK